MRSVISKLLIVFFACALCMDSPASNENDTRNISIEVHVEDFRGEPLEQVLLGVYDGKITWVDGVTDNNGDVTFELELPKDISHIEIRPSFAEDSSLSNKQQIELAQRLAALARKYATERLYVHFEPGKQTYRVEYVFLEAITMTGVVVGENDEPIGNIVYGRNVPQLGDARGRKQFQINGVRKGADVTLLATAKREESVARAKPVFLTNKQTQNDVNLGRIVFPEFKPGGQLDISLQNLDVIPNRKAGVTFIKADASMLFGVSAYRKPHERAGKVAGNPIALPAGEYYIAPGYAAFLPEEEIWALVEALHEGRDVDEFDLEKVTVKKDETQAVTLDLAEVQKAIRKMIND